MNIPGFTAEATLYKTTGRYLMGGYPSDAPNLEVVLALAPWFRSKDWGYCAANCLENCRFEAEDPFGIKGSIEGFEAESFADCAHGCDRHCNLLYSW
jgi:hypothetical protein